MWCPALKSGRCGMGCARYCSLIWSREAWEEHAREHDPMERIAREIMKKVLLRERMEDRKRDKIDPATDARGDDDGGVGEATGED
jgi:hypothetical protein